MVDAVWRPRRGSSGVGLLLSSCLLGGSFRSAVAHGTPVVVEPRNPFGARAGLVRNLKLDAATCHGGLCGGMATYPAKPGIHYFATFDVPGLPQQLDGITYYIYFNIFFRSPEGSDGLMNQFVPQLMLGEPLCDSTGPPEYRPLWRKQDTWVFGSQYFFELRNRTTGAAVSHAATGRLFPTKQGEILWTSFELSSDWVWTLSMGVIGDTSRTSVVVAAKPFMGLLPVEQTASWSEDAYGTCVVNSCWELYGMRDRAHYPSSGSRYDMRITSDVEGAVDWQTHWNASIERSNCTGAPRANISEDHNATRQDVLWQIFYPQEPTAIEQYI